MIEGLDSYKEELFRCMRCGLCLPSCPVYSEEKIESSGPRGRLSLIESYTNGRFNVSKIYKDRIKKCIGCRSCYFECPAGIKIDEIIHASKEDIFENQGLRVFPLILKVIIKRRSSLFLSFKMLNMINKKFYKKRIFLLPGKSSTVDKNLKVFRAKKTIGKVIFFRGCLINFIYTDIEKASIEVLNKLGFDVIFIKNEICCGAPLYYHGDKKGFKEIAKINIELFNTIGEAPVVSACPTCTLTLKNHFRDVFPENKISTSVWDINEFIMKHSKISFKGFADKIRATYHDPCHLKGSLGIHKEPRLFLESIPNVSFIEMKEPDRCCGFGGLYSFFYYDLSKKIAHKKFEFIINTEADTLITSCPGCMMHIQRTLTRENSPIEVKHTVEILREANIYV